MTAKDRLRQFLQTARLTQSEVSLESGHSVAYVNNLLSGPGRIPQDFATRLAEEYSLSLDWLFMGRGAMFTFSDSGTRAAESESPYAIIPMDHLIAEVKRRGNGPEQAPPVPKTREQ